MGCNNNCNCNCGYGNNRGNGIFGGYEAFWIIVVVAIVIIWVHYYCVGNNGCGCGNNGCFNNCMPDCGCNNNCCC